MKRLNLFARMKRIPRTTISGMAAILTASVLLLGASFALASLMVKTGPNTVSTGSFEVTFRLLKDTATNLTDAESWGAIDDDKALFDCANWQQTSAAVKVIRVENTGTIPVKWKAVVVSEDGRKAAGDVDLTEVIDVYCKALTAVPQAQVNPVAEVTTYDLSGWTKLGTLRQLLDGEKSWPVHVLKGGETCDMGIALQMQASADAKYLGQTASFVIQFMAVQALEDNDQWTAEDTPVTAPSGTTTPDGPAPEETTASSGGSTPAPEETTASPTPNPMPAAEGVYRAEGETAEEETDLKQTKLGADFAVTYREGGEGKLLNSAYSLTKGELRTRTSEPYALTIKPTAITDDTDFKVFVRSRGVADMNDEFSGDGIQVRVRKNGERYKLFITVKTTYSRESTDSEWTISGWNIPIHIDAIDTVTIADDGETVYVLVNDTIYAAIELSGSIDHYLLTQREDILFAEKVGIHVKDGVDENGISTVIASDCNAECGVVALKNATFIEISLQPFSTVEDTIEENLASFEETLPPAQP